MHRTADDVEQFGRDGLLTRLVVGERQGAEQVVGIIGSHLHGDDAGRVFAGQAVEQGREELEAQGAGNELCYDFGYGGFDDIVDRRGLSFCLLFSMVSGNMGSWVRI